MIGRKLKTTVQKPKIFKKAVFNFHSLVKNNLLFKTFLFLIVLGLIIPIQSAQAGSPLDWIVGIGEDTLKLLANITIGTTLQVIAAIGNVFLGIAAGLLGWITKGFTSLSYTNAGLSASDPSFNPVIGIGWKLVRDLANTFLVLVLIILALTITLRVREGFIAETLGLTDTSAKKYLGRLIIIALLINFTPVICGLVVDAGNILMNFFIKDLAGWGSISTPMEAQKNAVINLLEHPTDPTFLGQSIGLATFAWLGAAILFLYVILFAMRYVAIWILVILSPLAFLASIIPATKKLFTQWWNQLIQWSFIGATAGFFLYLSYYILYLANQNNSSALQIRHGAGKGIIGGGFIDSILPYSVVIAFLYIGFFVAISTNAAGASGVISGAQKGFRIGSKWIGKKGWEKTKSATARAVTLKRQPPLPKEKLAKMKGRELWGYRFRRAASVVTGMDIAAPYALQARKAEITRAEKEAEKILDPSMFERKLKTPGISIDQKLGLATTGIKRGGSFKKAVENVLGSKGAVKLASEANIIGAGPQAAILGKAFIKDVDKMGFKVTDKDRENWKTKEEIEKGIIPDDKTIIQRKLTGAPKGDAIKELGEEFINSDIGKEVIPNFWGGHELGKAAQEFGRIAVDSINKNFKEIEIKNPGWFAKYNPKIPRYFRHTPAQDAGYNPDIFKAPKSGNLPPSSSGSSPSQPIQHPPYSKPPKGTRAGPRGNQTNPPPGTRPGLRKKPPYKSREKTGARIPFMITRKMREDLKKTGYTDREIDKMTPEEAWKKLNKDL